MKSKKVIGIGTILILTVFLFTISLATDSEKFVFNNGVTWASTIDEVLILEGVDENSSNVDIMQNGNHTDLSIMDDSTGSIYNYQNSQLVAVFLIDFVKSFSTLLDHYTDIYGMPSESDRGLASKLYNALLPDGGYIDEKDIESIAGWKLVDGTYIYLLDLHGEIAFVYFNTLALLSESPDETGLSTTDSEKFVFSNGVTWKSTLDDVMTLEGVDGNDPNAYVMQSDTSAQLSISNELTGIIYSYQYSQLVAITCYFMTDSLNSFSVQLGKYSDVYGASSESDKSFASRLYNALLPDGYYITENDIESIAGWKLADGTYIYLLDLHGDVALIYFNTAPLLS